MEKRISYYVSRKNWLTWLVAAIMTCSAIVRIAYFCVFVKGPGAATVWFQIVLPVLACVIYVLDILCSGEERFYRTAIPVFLLAAYFGIRVSMSGVALRYIFLCWIAFLAFAVVYDMTVSGKLRNDWLLAILHAGALAFILYENRTALRAGDFAALRPHLADMLLLLAGFLAVFALQIHLDGRYHPTWGDRTDGRKLRTIDPMMIVAGYIMPNRNGAANHMRDSVEITAMERYIREKRREGLTNFGITHVFLAAYVRIVAKYPAVNRFYAGQHIFTRDDDIQFCMVVKTAMDEDAPESIMKLHLKPTDTAYDVYEKFNKGVEEIKGQPLDSSFDKTAKVLSMIPGVLFKFTIWFLKLLDYFGLLAKYLLEVSPFHASIFFTSMGSLGIPPVVHHLYDFGSMPVFCAFGCKRHVNELDDEGNLVHRKYVDYTFNCDERIVDGFYFASTLKYMKRLMQHPERLDVPPEEVNRDID